MKRGGGPAQHKAREAMIKIMAVVVPIILIMALIGDRYIFGGSKFGTAKSLKYGLMLLAVVAAVVGGYFLLKKPDGRVDDLGSTPIYGVYDAPGHPWDGKPCNRYDRRLHPGSPRSQKRN